MDDRGGTRLPPGRGPLGALRRLLAERSRRGRIASWVLVLAAVVAAAVILYAFFPRRPDPKVTLALPGPAGVLGALPTIHAWPGMRLHVSGYHMTTRSPLELRIDDRRLRVVVSTADGVVGTLVSIPDDIRPGPHTLVATDLGSGKVAARRRLVVEDAGTPRLVVQPDAVRAGRVVAVTGGGFAPRTRLRLVLSPPPVGARAAALAEATTSRRGIAIATVRLAADLPQGSYAVQAVGTDGRAVGTSGPLRIR